MTMRLLGCLCAAALVLAACGSDEPTATSTPPPGADPTPGATPDTAADATPDATPDALADVGDEAATIASAADATLAEGSAAFTATAAVDSTEVRETFTSTGQADFDGDRRALRLDTPSGQVQALVTAEHGILLSLPFLSDGWARVDPRMLRGTPLEAYGLATLPLQDPNVNLALLRGTTSATDLGETSVGGETLRHYEVEVDVDAAAQATDDPTARQAMQDAAAEAGTSTIPMEVWIDTQDRIRRIRQTVDAAQFTTAAGAPSDGTVEIVIDLDSFGSDVTVTEPSENEIIELDEETLDQLVRQATDQASS
jgi:hypothetical protein